MAAAILDRVLERGRFIHLDGPSGRTRHLNLEETLPENTKRLRISGIGGSDFPEPTYVYVERSPDRMPERGPVLELRAPTLFPYKIPPAGPSWIAV
jgi:hypothetical protein